MYILILLSSCGFQWTQGYCIGVGVNPGFTASPEVTQVNLTSILVSWKGLVTNIECADEFIVKSWQSRNPNDYSLSGLLPLTQFSYVVRDVVPNQDYVVQIIAREDKGLLGKDYNRSPKTYYKPMTSTTPTTATPSDSSTVILENTQEETQQVPIHKVDSSMSVGEDVGRGCGSELVSSHPDPVSSHILDTTLGLPATNLTVSMWRLEEADKLWNKLGQKKTNQDGRASGFISWDHFTPGTYKMHFATGKYFKNIDKESFYPYAEVVFDIRHTEKHYHIALLLNPFGYTTYRGS